MKRKARSEIVSLNYFRGQFIFIEVSSKEGLIGIPCLIFRQLFFEILLQSWGIFFFEVRQVVLKEFRNVPWTYWLIKLIVLNWVFWNFYRIFADRYFWTNKYFIKLIRVNGWRKIKKHLAFCSVEELKHQVIKGLPTRRMKAIISRSSSCIKVKSRKLKTRIFSLRKGTNKIQIPKRVSDCLKINELLRYV